MSWIEKYELKLLWPFYLEQFIGNLFFIYPIFSILYFLDNNFSLTQIGIFFGLLGFSVIIFEMPTGAIADLYGRKFSVILGNLLIGINLIIIMFAKDFFLICILYFLWGLFYTLTSGSRDAWFVDLLKTNKKGKKIHDLNSVVTAISSGGVIIAGIIGAFLVKYFGLEIIWIFSGMAFILAGLALLFAKQEHIEKKELNLLKTWQNIFNQMKNSGKKVYNDSNIFYLIIAGMFLVIAIIFAGDLTFYPLIKEAGFKEYYFGFLISICYSIGLLVPLINKSLIKKLGGPKKYIIGIISLLFIFTFPIILINHLYGYLALYIIGFFLFIFYGPVRFSFFHSFLPSKKRATIDSIGNMINALIIAIISPIVGFTADTLGYKWTIFIGALFYIPAIIMYSKVKGEGRKHL